MFEFEVETNIEEKHKKYIMNVRKRKVILKYRKRFFCYYFIYFSFVCCVARKTVEQVLTG